MLNRKVAPNSIQIKSIDFKEASSVRINNRVNIHYFKNSELNVIRAKILFDAGINQQHKPLVASFTNSLLLEGCKKFSAYELAKAFDNIGAFIDTECTADSAGIILHCLSKDFSYAIYLIATLLETATFPEKEFHQLLEIKRQKFQINAQKVSFVAKNEFNNFILGSSSEYANKVDLSDFDRLDYQDIIQFYNEKYKSGQINMFLAGDVSNRIIESLKENFPTENRSVGFTSKNKVQVSTNNSDEFLKVEIPNAIQTAIRIGGITLSKNHPDFPILYLSNLILGGYFGSRLMTNIREDKGYTYGIGSQIVNLKSASYLVISTEVGAEVVDETLIEIENEMNLLQHELVSTMELNRVKNYCIGSLLKGFDGSFAIIDRFQMLHNLNLDYTYYTNLINRISNCTPEEILGISKKYLNYIDMKKVLVGKT